MQEEIVKDYPPLSKEGLKSFLKGIGTALSIAPTLATYYRDTEYEWLRRLSVQLEGLIHTEQSYEFHEEWKPEASVQMRTRLLDVKERQAGNQKIRFIKLETKIHGNGILLVSGLTTFVERTS